MRIQYCGGEIGVNTVCVYVTVEGGESACKKARPNPPGEAAGAAEDDGQCHEEIAWSAEPDTVRATTSFRDNVIHPHVFQQVGDYYCSYYCTTVVFPLRIYVNLMALAGIKAPGPLPCCALSSSSRRGPAQFVRIRQRRYTEEIELYIISYILLCLACVVSVTDYACVVCATGREDAGLHVLL